MDAQPPCLHTLRRFPDGEINPTLAYDGCYTIYELFRRSVAIWPNRPFLGHRPIDSEVRREGGEARDREALRRLNDR